MPGAPRMDRVYANRLFDSRRWSHFNHRPGDILVCTSYKAGTTWTQMICALLVHQTTDLPASLAVLSPWLDIRLDSIDNIVEAYEAQSHRRIVKTHTPLDGLPWKKDAKYVFCGREPRDVFMSLQSHLSNANTEKIARLLKKQGNEIVPPPELPDDINERFKIWMTTGTFDWEEDGLPYWSHFHHALTYWNHRHLPNIQFLHYADLIDDLEGQMRRVAEFLEIEIAEEKWPGFVKAATFDEMKANADRTAPDTNHGIWESNARFFNKGRNGQWRGVLSDDSLKLYDKVSRARYDPVFLDWLEQGSLRAGYPETL